MDTLCEAIRDEIRGKTRKETRTQMYRYEGTARIKERKTGYYELEDFTL
jgi:hypothetical protein